jgi:hypothetical protein
MSRTGDAEQLLGALNRARAGFIELRVIRQTAPPIQEFFPATEVAAAASRAVGLRDQGDVYFGVVARERQLGTKEAIATVPVLFADLDDEAAQTSLHQFPLAPTALVKSGSGVHAYWVLDEAIEPAQAESLLRRLALTRGSDERVTDAGRVLRVPGTLNHKIDPPARVELLELHPERVYRSEDVGRELPDDHHAGTREPRRPSPNSPSAAVQKVLERLDGVREAGAGWTALCPAHDDTRPSLSVNEGDDGRALVHCFAGCAADDVIKACGLNMADLFAGTGDQGHGSIATELVDLAQDAGAELFHDELGQAFAAVPVGDHSEVWKLESRSFKRWLRRELHRRHRRVAGNQAVADAVEVLSAEAEFDGPERKVHVRVAGDHDRIQVDLGDSQWRAVEITTCGYTIVAEPQVPFVRRGATAALATPVEGGAIDDLREFVNFASERDWLLMLAFLVMALMPKGPDPILILFGESGAAKSTTSRVLRLLVDPVRALLRAGSPTERDLMVAASGSWIVGFDNMRKVSDRLSDALCQLATGAGFGTRQLYTDDEEFVFEAMRPAMLNGIGQIANRPDLISRVVAIELPVLGEADVVDETTFWERFEAARPLIQGALFELVASTLRELPEVELDRMPRMADFARVGTALERALGLSDGSFLDALGGQRNAALQASLDADPVAAVLIEFMRTQPEWSGSATTLLTKLTDKADEDIARRRTWPTDASSLGKRLTELAPALRELGLEIDRGHAGRGKTKKRELLIFWAGDSGDSGEA